MYQEELCQRGMDDDTLAVVKMGWFKKQRIDKEFWRDSAWHPVKLTCF